MHARKKCVTAAVTFSPWQREHRFGRERGLFYFIASTHQVSSRMTVEGQGEGWGGDGGIGQEIGPSSDLAQLCPEVYRSSPSMTCCNHCFGKTKQIKRTEEDSHFACRELFFFFLSHKHVKCYLFIFFFKKDALTEGSIHMQYNVSSPSD